jgi:adsorption protein B
MNLAVIAGYVVGIYLLGMFAFNQLHEGSEMPPMIAADEIYWKLGALVLVFFSWRMINRMIAVWRIYGFGDALLSIPRLLVGNMINFCATVMAIQCFVKVKIFRKQPTWRETEHAWPSEDQLGKYHREIGDLLIERRVITEAQLEKAQAAQAGTNRKLGEVLVEMGDLWEEDLMFSLAAQRHEKAIEIDPYSRPDLIDTLPKSVAEKYRVFPVDNQGETLVLGTDVPKNNVTEGELSEYLARPVAFRATSREDIDFAINRAYRDKDDMPENLNKRIGPRLVQEGKITQEQLHLALQKQKRSNQKLGEVLIEMELLTPEELNEHLEDQQS